jgi:hypothetical protein
MFVPSDPSSPRRFHPIRQISFRTLNETVDSPCSYIYVEETHPTVCVILYFRDRTCIIIYALGVLLSSLRTSGVLIRYHNGPFDLQQRL